MRSFPLALVFVALLAAGCADGGDTADDGASNAGGRPGTVESTTVVSAITYTMGTSAGLAAPDGSHRSLGITSQPVSFTVERGEPTTAKLTAFWNTTNPGASSLWLRAANDTAGWSVEGPSPLVLELPSDIPAGEYSLFLLPANGGATAGEEVSVVIEFHYGRT